MTVLRVIFLDPLPGLNDVNCQLTEDTSNLSENRFETLLREIFAFPTAGRGSRWQESKYSANHACTKSTCSRCKGRKGN